MTRNQGSHPWLQHSSSDAILIGLAILHGAALFVVPSIAVIGLGFWWNTNTVAHNFIHLPFFRHRGCNLFFSAGLSLILGIPQSLWRDRHLAHHRGQKWKLRLSRQLIGESLLVAAFWLFLGTQFPGFFALTYLPGLVLGLTLCALQGRFEHHPGTISHYGRFYNLLFFNDGYHCEHHARPGRHWTRLADARQGGNRASAWPATLRWLEFFNLDHLERLALRSAALRSFLLKSHMAAFRRQLGRLPFVKDARIVGGGVFPRTALVVRALSPETALTIVDVERGNLDLAKAWFHAPARWVEMFYEAEQPGPEEMVIIPLAFRGDRERCYVSPGAKYILVHDWIWRPRGESVVISWWLLKRLNLIRR